MDNMGKLFVMLFAFAPAPRQIRNGSCTRTRASARNIISVP